MFLRAIRIVDPEFLDNEFSVIYNIGLKLCYPLNFLDQCLKLAKKSFYNNEKEPFEYQNILSLPYHPSFNNIPRLLKHLNINVVFTFVSIKNLIINNNPSKSGIVYKIPCFDCTKVYIGQTGKNLKTRLSQHKYSVRNANNNNAIFIPSFNNNHNINWEGSNIIKPISNFISRNIFESTCIKFVPNFNTSSGIYKLDNIILNEIKKQNANTFLNLN